VRSINPRSVAYVCATAITIAAFYFGHDGTLAAMVIAAMLGGEKIAQKKGKSKSSS